MNAHFGVRALRARVFSLALGVLEPPRTSDCTIAVVSGGLGSTRGEAPSPFLVVTELRELVFYWRGQLESTLGCACAPCLRF